MKQFNFFSDIDEIVSLVDWMEKNGLNGREPQESIKEARDLIDRYFNLLISQQKVIFQHNYYNVGFIKVCTHLARVFPSLPSPTVTLCPHGSG